MFQRLRHAADLLHLSPFSPSVRFGRFTVDAEGASSTKRQSMRPTPRITHAIGDMRPATSNQGQHPGHTDQDWASPVTVRAETRCLGGDST